MLIDIAYRIYKNEVELAWVWGCFSKHGKIVDVIMEFWTNHDEVTKQVVNSLALYKCVRHLENCLDKQSFRHSPIEN